MMNTLKTTTAAVGRSVARALALSGLLASVGATVAAAPAMATATSCSPPALTQPFLAWGDSNWYALPGGESYDNVDGTGWTLSGGAKLVTATLYDGTTGYVLDLPSGAQATSPAVCVSSNYPLARAMARQMAGIGGVKFMVSYQGGKGWSSPKATGLVTGSSAWAPSVLLPLSAPMNSSWSLGRYTFSNIAKGTDFQLYNFYVDPYAK